MYMLRLILINIPESLIGIFDKLKPNINEMIIAHYRLHKF